MAFFPVVPQVPGVPAVLRLVGAAVPAPVLLIADAITAILGLTTSQWGIFKGGVPVVLADSVVQVGIRKSYELSSFPVEEGAFESYDKVETPLESMIRFTAGGTDANREALLSSIEELVDSLELFDVVMPEKVYESVNLVSFDFRRSSSAGLGLLSVDVRIMEVRVTAQTDYSNTKQPQGAQQQNGGTVQPQVFRGADLEPLAGIK